MQLFFADAVVFSKKFKFSFCPKKHEKNGPQYRKILAQKSHSLCYGQEFHGIVDYFIDNQSANDTNFITNLTIQARGANYVLLFYASYNGVA